MDILRGMGEAGFHRLSVDFSGHYFIYKAPDPRFSWFNGTNQGVFRAVKVFGGVAVLGRIAAAYMSADETEAEVDPSFSHFQAFLAPFLIGMSDFDLIGVMAGGGHR